MKKIQKPRIPISSSVPYPDTPIFRAREHNRQFRMEANRRNVLSMTFKSLDTRLVLVIPDLDASVVSARNEVRLVSPVEVIHAIDPLVVAFQSEVGRARTQLPNLQRLVQRRTGKGIVVLGIPHDLHHVVQVTLEHLHAHGLFPIPQLDQHIICERMYISDVVVKFGKKLYPPLHVRINGCVGCTMMHLT